MRRRCGGLALSMAAATVVFSGVPPAPSAQRADDKPLSAFVGRYFGQAPPGMAPQRFAPGFISTEGYDITPTFSPALDEVFSGHRPTEAGSDNKIYHSRMVNGRWQQPALASFSSGGMEFEAQFSVDGNTLYFNRGSALYFSQRTGSAWSEARPIEPPADRGMCVAAAGNGTLYFTSARRPGIVRCRRVDGIYQAPEVVVSPGSHPWVAPDESYLVFDRYSIADGAQTSRLFVSFSRKDGSWSEPVDLGNGVNATGTELIPKVSPDGKYLFFQRKVNGNTDIYWVDARVIELARGVTGVRFARFQDVTPDRGFVAAAMSSSRRSASAYRKCVSGSETYFTSGSAERRTFSHSDTGPTASHPSCGETLGRRRRDMLRRWERWLLPLLG